MAPKGTGTAVTTQPSTAMTTTRQISFAHVVENWPAYVQIAQSLAASGKCGDIRSKDSVIAILLQGSELGLPPMTAINSIHAINGKLSLSASAAQAIVLRDFPGSRFAIKEEADACEVTLSVPGRDPYTARYTTEEATQAGLVKAGSNWMKFKKDMLFSKAVLRACRRVAPDALAGMYSPEELGEQPAINAPSYQTAATMSIVPPADTTTATSPDAGEIIDAEYSATSESAPNETATATTVEVPVQPVAAVATAAPVTAKRPPAVIPPPAGESSTAAATESNGTPAAAKASPAQLTCLKQLKTDLKPKDVEWLSMLEVVQKGAKSATELNTSAADHLIGILRKRQETAPGFAGKNGTTP